MNVSKVEEKSREQHGVRSAQGVAPSSAINKLRALIPLLNPLPSLYRLYRFGRSDDTPINEMTACTRGEKISVRSSNHLTHLIPSKEMTIEEAMQNFRAIGEVLYVPKCL